MGGDTNSSQVVLSSSSTDSKLVTKGPEKNTEGKRCFMVPLHGMSKVHRTHGPIIMILIQVSIRTANPSSALCSMWRTQMMKVTALLTVRAQIRIQMCLTQRIARMGSKRYRSRFQHLILQQSFAWKDQGIRNPRTAEPLN